MPACGTTGPSSLYSNVALANAEALSAVVLFQMANPGTPIIYGFAVGNTDFSKAGFLTGSPEMTLMNSALCEMSRYYQLPNTQSACSTDAPDGGSQAILEKVITALPAVMTGPDLIVGIGEIESANLLILEQILVDHEIAMMCKRIKDGIDVSDEKNYFDDVAAVKPSGHFLTTPSTLKSCRSDEFFVPELYERNTHEKWSELGCPDIYSKARKKVKAILDKPQKHPLPDQVIEKFNKLMEHADKHL